MKKIILLTILSAFLAACSQLEVPMVTQSDDVSIKKHEHFITHEQALSIADRITGHTMGSRSILDGIPEVMYVSSSLNTRSGATYSIPDTLAYVINYPNDGGFAIVSADNRVYPVLAYSNTGSFTFDNEIVRDNFVNNIQYYLSDLEGITTYYDVDSGDFDSCQLSEPLIQISLGQRNPWDKYVIQEHPNCPVGCVAVAAGLVMTHARDTLYYHGVKYPTKHILEVIKKGPNPIIVPVQPNGERRIGVKPGTGTIATKVYMYGEAVDSMAKILYWIGKDVNMTYTTHGSSAVSRDAYLLCQSLNYDIPSGWASYDMDDIIQYLKDGYIVYLRGRDYTQSAGHAWVTDGYRLCTELGDSTKIISKFLHCDWGWSGTCNGYYSGEVFSAGGYNFSPLNYFAVRIEQTKLIHP